MAIVLTQDFEPSPLSEDVERPSRFDSYWARRRDGWNDGCWRVVAVMENGPGNPSILPGDMGNGWIACNDPRVQMGPRIPSTLDPPKTLATFIRDILRMNNSDFADAFIVELQARICTHCGRSDEHGPDCQCWNDE